MMAREQVVLSRLEVAEVNRHRRLRLWLRLLTATSLLEGELRRRLRACFGSTLPRFDLLAQLDKAQEGLTMSELSRRMMVTNGNVTGLVQRLTEEGLVVREVTAEDRRQQRVRLTEAGRRSFTEMAEVHHGWIDELLGDLDEDDVTALMALLARLKGSIHRHELEESTA